MPKLELSWPDGYELTRLQLTSDGYEASILCYSKPDKWGQAIPTQTGYGWKQKTPKRAVEIATEEARKKMASLLSLRNSKPDPRAPKLSPEDELMKALGL